MAARISVQGMEAEAVCFTDRLDDVTERDLRQICGSALMRDRHIRIMPDVHANGDGSLTGFTMLSQEPVILKLEYGSGCGVACAELDLKSGGPVDMQRLDSLCHEIPAGAGNGYFEPAYEYDFSVLRCFGHVSSHYEWPAALGTLGGGNHFIELDSDDDGRLYLVVHNGLGGLSRPVVNHYLDMVLAGTGRTVRQACMEETCLYGRERDDYLHDMKVFEDVCRVNRRYIIDHIVRGMGWEIADYLDICHHCTDESDGIVRHGAIAAHEGRRVIIPVNAGEGCILGTGRGDPDWNYSAPHGGGRLFSRTDAKRKLSMEQYRKSMQGVYTTTVADSNLDEAPAAYKTMDFITRAIRDTVEIDKIIRPVYSYKGM